MDSHITELQERLTGALIGIARAVDGNEHLISPSTDALMREALAASRPDAEPERLTALIRRAEEEKRKLVPHCYECASPCGRTANYDLRRLRDGAEEVFALKLLLLCGVRAMAAEDSGQEAGRFFYQALFAVGEESFGVEELLPLVRQFGRVSLRRAASPDGARADQ